MEDPGLKAPELLVQRVTSPLSGSCFNQAWLSTPPQEVLSAVTLILLIEVTIKNRSVQKGHSNFGTPPSRPHLPLAWPRNVGEGFFHGVFQGTHSHLNSYQPPSPPVSHLCYNIP